MKKIIYEVLIVIVLLVVLSGILFFVWQKEHGNQNQSPAVNVEYKNLTYVIEGVPAVLVNGHAEKEAAPGSTSKIVTDYFGNEAKGDINADGLEDVVFLLTQSSGGSGTFYYVTAAVKTPSAWEPVNTIFLGDRIAPQTTEIKDGVVVVNYADRAPGEPMTAQPSVGVSKYLKIENGVLTEKSFNPMFGMPRVIKVGDSAQYVDGLTVTLQEINDSRCKEGVVCVWAGELSPHFVVSGGNIRQPNTQVIMGTTTQKSTLVDGYTIELKEVTETSVTVLITRGTPVAGSCYVGGCSGQICSDQTNVVSTCEYSEKYACYKTAKCERQTSGQCGWTETAELTACLNK